MLAQVQAARCHPERPLPYPVLSVISWWDLRIQISCGDCYAFRRQGQARQARDEVVKVNKAETGFVSPFASPASEPAQTPSDAEKWHLGPETFQPGPASKPSITAGSIPVASETSWWQPGLPDAPLRSRRMRALSHCRSLRTCSTHRMR